MRSFEQMIRMHPDLTPEEIQDLEYFNNLVESGRYFQAIIKLGQFLEKKDISRGASSNTEYLIWACLLELARLLRIQETSIEELIKEDAPDIARKRINAFKDEEDNEVELEEVVDILILMINKHKDKRRKESRDQKIVRMAYLVLAGIGSPSVVDFMIEQIEKQEKFDQHAIRNLGSISGERGIDCLIKVIDEAETFGTRQDAAISLGKINHPRAVEKLIQLVKDPSNPKHTEEKYNKWVRFGALEGLGYNDSDDALDFLIDIMKSNESDDIKKQATQGMWRKKDEKKIKRLVDEFDSTDDIVKVSIAFALGSMGTFEQGKLKEDRYSILEELLDTITEPQLLKTVFLAAAYSNDGRLFPLLIEVRKREYIKNARGRILLFEENLDMAFKSLKEEYEKL